VVVGAPNGCARGCPTPEEEKEAEAREQPSGAPVVENPAARIEAERRGERAMPKGGTANGSGGTLAEHVYSAVDVSTFTPRAARSAISLIWSAVKSLLLLAACCFGVAQRQLPGS
jgi:hypothetical protein